MAESDSSARLRVSKNRGRPRASSIQDALDSIEHDPSHHIAGAMAEGTPDPTPSSSPNINSLANNAKLRYGNEKRRGMDLPGAGTSRVAPSGFWHDVISMRWMREPAPPHPIGPICPLILAMVKAGWLVCLGLFPPFVEAHSSIQGPGVFVTIHIIRPIAMRLGVRKEAKLDRFAEQGYAARTEYPHWRMTPLLKTYYLLQASYWTQQLLVLVLGLEKPRKDYLELVIHHLVTIYLISSSYIVNLTWIGNAVFITMDVSDVFLALSKIFNYLKMNKTKFVSFGWFTVVWSSFNDPFSELMPFRLGTRGWILPMNCTWLGCQSDQTNSHSITFGTDYLNRAIFAPDLDKVDDDRSDDEGDDADDESDDNEKSD
ncbi:TLC domain-containing protein [Rhizoctonia solani AG-1 IA]|uniref:TLC domain-containing protein n=1 Tax=Thanatephorus cucumeris (strain AG1-IA) TaxID=983506 RepID=L8X595_THACA|nr:TLC domain-containing protein [Rhizoctonia solani AG-1 IA]